jgi:ankyrin repeat protein
MTHSEFVFAILRDDLTKVQLGITQGININETGDEAWTPLIWAIHEQREHSISIIKLLLDNGANPNYGEEDTDEGETALCHAAQCGNIEAIKLLLAFKADINKPDLYGWTPLRHALNEETQKILIEHGAIKLEEK